MSFKSYSNRIFYEYILLIKLFKAVLLNNAYQRPSVPGDDTEVTEIK